MKKIVFVFLVFFISNLAIAGQNGGYAGSHLRIGLGARGTALGNAIIAGQPDGYSVYYNPAAVGFIEGKTVALSYSFMSLDRLFNFVSFSMKLPPSAGLSIGLINSGYKSFYSYNSVGWQTEKINQSANTAFFNFSRKFIDIFSIGLSIKYNWEDIDDGTSEFEYSSQGWGWDFGIIYHVNDNIVLAATARDVGSKFKANTTEIFERGGTTIDKFPALYNFGGRYITPLKWLRLHYTFQTSSKKDYRHFMGAEARYNADNNADEKHLALRLGLSNGSFTAGAGMSFELLNLLSRLDYAFYPSVVDEGSSHIFSWQFYLE